MSNPELFDIVLVDNQNVIIQILTYEPVTKKAAENLCSKLTNRNLVIIPEIEVNEWPTDHTAQIH